MKKKAVPVKDFAAIAKKNMGTMEDSALLLLMAVASMELMERYERKVSGKKKRS